MVCKSCKEKKDFSPVRCETCGAEYCHTPNRCEDCGGITWSVEV